MSNSRKFLDFLGKAESADYNVIVGGNKFTDFSRHPNVVGVRTKDGPSTAAGKYQITKTTYDDFAPKLGITDFSPESQDRIAEAIITRHGADKNIEAGDFNGAIKKLGGRWASLPSSPYGQAKRSWEWTAKNLDGATAPGLAPQFTTGTSDPLTAAPSPSQTYRDGQQQDAKYGGYLNGAANLPSAIAGGFRVDNSVYNWWQDRGISSVDENFKWTDETSEQFLKGIPSRHHGYILQATSEREATIRKSRLAATMETEQELGRMGGVGFTGRLVGGLVDLPTVVAFLPGMGGAGLLTATSRISNAARLGVFNGAFNVAADAATAPYRPTSVHDSLYISAAMGLGLGGAIGGALSPGKIAARRLAAENQAVADFGLRQGAAAQRAELTDVAGGAGGIDQARMDAAIPGGKPANVDSKMAAGQADGAVEDVISRIRDEDAAVRARMDDMVSGSADRMDGLPRVRRDTPIVADDAGRGADDVAGKVDDAAAKADDVPVYDRTNARPTSPRGTGGRTTARAQLAELKNSDDPLVAGLAARLEGQLGDDIPVHMQDASFRSHYNPGTHRINLREGAPDYIKLHEIAHAVTANKIRYGVANPNTAHGQLTKELNDVFEQVKILARREPFTDSKAKYYLTNIDEFVAGIYSGKGEFIDFLAKTKMSDNEGHSFLSKAVDVVRKILGMSATETNALTKALGITDKLIDTPLSVRQKLVNQKTGKSTTAQYRMEPGDTGAAADSALLQAANDAEIPTIFGWGLGLENKLGGAKAPSAVRELASKLFGTTIGYKDHSVVKANAWDDVTKWADSWAVEMRKGAYPAFEDWFKQSGRKWSEKGKAFDEFGTEVSRYIRGFEGDFSPQVMKAGDQMRTTLAKVVDYINNPLFDEGLIKKGLTEVEVLNVKTGTTELLGKLEKNPNYLPRKHDINKWNDMATHYGRDAVEGWWARAYKKGRTDVSDEAATKWSKWYVKTVEEAHANRSQDLLEDMMRGTDKDALKNSLKMNGGFDDVEAQKIIDGMFPTISGAGNDAGRMSSLKHRNTIDETHTETWTRSGGEQVEVRVDDFIHANAFDVVEPYLRRTAGAVALAKHLDIYKGNHIDDAIMDATTNKLGFEFKKPAELKKYRDDLKFTFDRIQGLPQEEFTGLNKAMEMWRNFNVIRLMGGAVWNQATEASQIIGSMGWKTTLGAVPELATLRRDILTGKAPNEILDHLENTIGGVGSEYVARMDFKLADDWVRNKGDTKFNRFLDSVDTAGKRTARGVLDYTGMTPMMIQQKRVHAVALVNHWVNTAKGAPSTHLSPERVAWMGMSQGDYQNVLKALDKYTKPKQGEFSKSHSMDFAKWTQEDPKSYSQFMTAIHRESRRVVQENDLGSMIPLMGSTLGKTVFQFMNFSMHGWNKSMNHAMNHRDWSTLSTVMHGSVFASLAYMGRTMLSAQGMSDEKKKEFLEKRMSGKQIVASSFGRLAQVSLLPVVHDTLSPYPMFAGMRTTSDLSSLASNPTYQAINGLLSMKKIIRNGTSDEFQTTEKDVRAWGKLAPLNNVYPISGFLNSWADDYPSQESTVSK